MHVGVIGAGVSGLVFADQLRKALGDAIRVTVLEWGRGPGGRTARRRVRLETGGEVSFDHAAPFFSAQSQTFRARLLEDWEARGLVQRWSPRRPPGETHDGLWVGTPSNHAICKALAGDLDELQNSVRFGRYAKRAEYVDGRWQLTASNRLENDATETFAFDALVLSDKLLAQPGQQYAVLSETDMGALTPQLPMLVRSSGQVALLLAFADPLPVEWDVVRPVTGPLALLVRDSAKPQRGTDVEIWTARSSPEYASAHLDGERLVDEAAVAAELSEAFFTALGLSVKPTPLVITPFAWDHAQPLEEDRLPELFSLDASRRLGMCGDYYASTEASGVEAAALSGLALSDAMVKLLAETGESCL